MQHVQKCKWNPFKFNEIVTLEKCLHDVAAEDPRICLILKKLATECVFVEPSRKRSHLERDPNQKRQDTELMKRVDVLKTQAKELDQKLEYYNSKLIELTESRKETRSNIETTSKSVILMEEKCEPIRNALSLTLERTLSSFEVSIPIIKTKIPEFIHALLDSPFVKQLENIGEQYRSYLIDKVKSSARSDSRQLKQLSYNKKTMMVCHLKSYLELCSRLLAELALIYRVCRQDVREELNYLCSFQSQVDQLTKPLTRDPPKKILVRHYDLKPVDQPEILVGPPRASDDSELNELLQMLNAKLKTI